MAVEVLMEAIVDSIASKAQSAYVEAFHNGPAPTQAERINPAGKRVNYKKTNDTVWIEQQRNAGQVLTGEQASTKPQGGIIEVDGVVYVDLAGRQYDDLPTDHKALNQGSAKVAAQSLLESTIAVHDAWALSNSYLVAEVAGNDRIYELQTAKEIYAFVLALSDLEREKLSLFVPFEKLTIEEQNKDFVFVTNASRVLDSQVNPQYRQEEVNGIAIAISAASAVHDSWVMDNLDKLSQAVSEESVLQLATPQDVYAYVATLPVEVREQLPEFQPFGLLPRELQNRSIIFVDAQFARNATVQALGVATP